MVVQFAHFQARPGKEVFWGGVGDFFVCTYPRKECVMAEFKLRTVSESYSGQNETLLGNCVRKVANVL